MDFNSKFGKASRDELSVARDELAQMFAEREALEVEIAKQQRRIAALAELVNEGEEVDELLELNLGGLSDAVRSVFRAASAEGLTPTETRDRLTHLHFPVNEYKNFLASLHVVLKRLETAGEIRKAVHDKHDGRDNSVYQWVPKYEFSKRLKGRFERRLRGRFERG